MGRSKNIWNNYKTYCESSYQERKGTIACQTVRSLGLDNSDDVYFLKPEFISEHMGRSAFLLGMILMYNPEIADSSDWFTMLMLILTHDIGEIVYGDTLDDGSMPEINRDIIRSTEAETVDELYCAMPSPWSTALINDFTHFEEYSGNNPALCKLVEKADAVLFQLFLYTKGLAGDTKLKHPHQSGRDRRFSKILGTSRSIDVWTLHLRVAAKEYKISELYTKPVRKVLKEAFRDTYRDIPLCMTIDVSDIPLDDPSDHQR